MLHRRRFLQLPGAGLVAAAPPHALAQQSAALPALARGVNLSHWFEYDGSKSVSPAELRALAAAGMDHVRLPVDPLLLGWTPKRPEVHLDLQPLRKVVQAIQQAGLAAVVDLHMVQETKQEIEEDKTLEPSLVLLWQRLAAALKEAPVRSLAFELYNEPQYYGLRGPRWPAIQARLLQAVRQVAPQHLVLMGGAQGGSFQGLKDLPLVEDPAVAYTVHFYDPFFFTHQGVPWLDAQHTAAMAWQQLRYPVPMAQLAPPKRVREHPKAQLELSQYLKENWDARRIEEALSPVGRWAKKLGVRVLCTEFGVFREGVDSGSRYRWLHDVRTALQIHGMGWTVWDYAHHFAISQKPGEGGVRALDTLATKALGLRSAT
jgi:endoglucanase